MAKTSLTDSAFSFDVAKGRPTFFALRTRHDVVRLLELSPVDFHFWFYRRGAAYFTFQVPKKSGGTRTVNAPEKGVKFVQRRLNIVLTALFRAHGIAHGFVTDRNIRTGASRHAGKRWVLNLDLKDFFDTIHFGRVRGLFRAMGIGFDAADALARICCHEGRLPQGAPTSPMISNLVCRSFDKALRQLAAKHDCSVTRYADDISFSTNQNTFPTALACLSSSGAVLGTDLNELLKSNSFEPQPGKTRLQGRGRRQQVTGLTVNEFPNLRRDYIRATRALIHNLICNQASAQTEFAKRFWKGTKGGPPADALSHLQGRLAFIQMIRQEADPVLAKLWNASLPLFPKHTARITSPDDLAECLWIVESVDDRGTHRGMGFTAKGVGIVTANHCLGHKVRLYQPARPEVKVAAKIVRRCSDRDLCVLELPPNCQTGELEIATVPSKLGQPVSLTWYPENATIPSRADGRILGAAEHFNYPSLFPDFAIVKGASGSPLLSRDLRVMGVALYGPDRYATTEDQATKWAGIDISELAQVPEWDGTDIPLLA